MALSDSFSKFILRLGENINNKTNEKNEERRPGSPFIMLLATGDEEFNCNPECEPLQENLHEMKAIDDLFENDSMGSSLKHGSSSCDISSGSVENVDFEYSGIVSDERDRMFNQPNNMKNLNISMAEDDLVSSDEVALKEIDELRSHRNNPLTKEQFHALFDPSGRLVNEHELRKAIFKGGVNEDIRKDVWAFLFEYYPFNTTIREREVLNVEKTVRYEAMKLRWKKLLKALVNDYEGVRYCPKWYSACPENASEYTEYLPVTEASISTSISEDTSSVIEEFKAEKLDLKVMIPKSEDLDVTDIKIKDPGIEMKSFNLVCHEDDHEELNIPDYMEGLPSSYEEKVSHRHKLLKSRGNSETEIEVELEKLKLYHQEQIESDGKVGSEVYTQILTSNGQCDTNTQQTDNSYKYISSSLTKDEKEVLDNKDKQRHSHTDDESTKDNVADDESTKVNVAERIAVLDISEALADAMLDIDNEVTMNEPNQTENVHEKLSKHESFNVVDENPSIYSDAIHVDTDNSYSDAPVGEPECQINDDLGNNNWSNEGQIIYPNPFTLPPEYINNHESLYSKSENFVSLDFVNLNALKHDNKNRNTESIKKYKNIIENKSCELETLDCFNVKPVDKVALATFNKPANVSDSAVSIHPVDVLVTKNISESAIDDMHNAVIMNSALHTENKIFNTSDKPTITSDVDINICDVHINSLLSDTPVECNIDNTEQEDNNGTDTDVCDGNTGLKLSSRSSALYQNLADSHGYIKSDASSQINNSVNRNLNLDYTRPATPKSPIGEELEKLPPWIAQMIITSTPPSKRSTKKHSTPVEMPEDVKHKNSLFSPIKKALVHDKNILGIVEKASLYLQEQAKANNGQLSPETLNKVFNPKVEESFNPKVEESFNPKVEELFTKQNRNKLLYNSATDLYPTTPVESYVDLSMNHTPKFQFISNDVDDVDFQTKNYHDATVFTDCPYCNFKPEDSAMIVSPASMGEDQLKFMEIQAQVFAARQPYDEKQISASIRVIDKDVPRTDRELPQFSGDDNPGLIKLRDALLTYAFFHPDVGYAQGMNDIMSRFLVVMDTETEAYWMFVNYMEHFKNDFMEEGMLRKIVLVEQLLMKMDRELYDFLQEMDMGLMFCHRWLLLNFKREFDYAEAIRLFEITSSRHLEVSSLEAEMERSKERAKEFVKDNAGSHLEEIYMCPEYPFDIFVCVTMLMECRDMILCTVDLGSVYQILSNLPTTLDLQNILRKSEELFYQYCRKTVVDCFQVIDELEVQEFKRKKKQFTLNFR